ncbi:uncharacterized protein LOC135841155 [Planococcus citri]|uniref:uncharacterized protein LOC135841155 n=1 Tax=Planococcus citri TaxID=170843 RepID=UPI0031FA0F35
MAFKIYLLGAVTLAICCITVDASMECKLFDFGTDKNAVTSFLDKVVNHCPILPGQDKEYCCYDINRKAYCCDASEFFVNMGIMLMIVIVVLMLISSIVSFICCICCPCCVCYKRRRGRACQPPQTLPSTHTAAPRYQNEYQPVPKTHLPPGAYPVFPPQPSVPRPFSGGSQHS